MAAYPRYPVVNGYPLTEFVGAQAPHGSRRPQCRRLRSSAGSPTHAARNQFQTKGIRKFIDIFLLKSEISATISAMQNSTDNRTRACRCPGEKREENGLRRFAYNLRRESIFLIFSLATL